MAAPRLVAAGRIAPHDQGPAAVAEIAGVAGVFRDLPQAGQANSVRMHQPAEAFSIRAPTQVGGGIDGALGGLAKGVGRTERQDAGEQTAQRDGVDRQRRLPVRPPCTLIGLANSASRTSEKREPAYARSSSVMPSIPNERGVTAVPSRWDQVALHVDGGVRLSRI